MILCTFSSFYDKFGARSSGRGAVPRSCDPVVHASGAACGVARVVGVNLVRELGRGRRGRAARAARVAADGAEHGAGGGDGEGVHGEGAVRAGGPGGGGAAVEALTGLVARERVAGT